MLGPGQTINVWRPNAIKHCLVTKHFTVWNTLFGAVWSCLYVFDRVWSCLIKCEGHQTFNQQLETFLLCSCFMGDLLFVLRAAYRTCLKRACVPSLLNGLYLLFHLSLIKLQPLTSTLACLVTKQCLKCLMVFGRQRFIVCPGPNVWWCLVAKHFPLVQT